MMDSILAVQNDQAFGGRVWKWAPSR